MKRKNFKITWQHILLVVLMLALAAAIPLHAYYLKYAGEVENKFAPADSVNPTVEENFKNFQDSVKENVSVKVGNTDYPVYVRAEIVITWQDKDGVVYYAKPTLNTDYTLDLNLNDWEQKGEYYYFKNPVASGGQTSNLINKCVQIAEAPAEGYTLSVDIIVQTVQAIGYTDDSAQTEAWKDAWGLS